MLELADHVMALSLFHFLQETRLCCTSVVALRKCPMEKPDLRVKHFCILNYDRQGGIFTRKMFAVTFSTDYLQWFMD